MNEITHVHLGRQSFTISIDAHKVLRHYLAEIKKHVGDTEVVDEVELRMAELLAERGVSGDKVILAKDVTYLQEQLGSPADFGDEEPTESAKAEDKTTKRLFRDTDNAMIAGVSAGLANYFGMDAVLIRLAFVLLTIFSGGFGILLYVILWLVVQPASTASEKLQMQGKPVTLEALKDSVNQADIKGAAGRVNQTVLPVINTIFRIAIKLTGIGLIIAGLGMIVGVAATKMYMLLHGGKLFEENLFPVGLRENWLFGLGMILVVLIAVFIILTGIAALKRKWPVSAWITGVLAGVFLIGSVAAVTLAADIGPRIAERYNASMYTIAVSDIGPFNKVVSAGPVDLTYISSPDYKVNVRANDPDISKLNISVKDGTLYIDSRAIEGKHCSMLCMFPRGNRTVQIYAPNVQQFKTPPHTDIFYPPAPPAL